MLNLTQLNAIAHVLDEAVLAAFEHNLATRIDKHQVARAVYNLRVAVVQWVLHKGGSGLFGVVVVAHGQRSATDAKLAFLVGLGDILVVLVENQNIGVAERLANRDRLVVGNFTLNGIVHTVERNLDGTVEVGKGSLWQAVTPDVELLGGEHLASKPAEAQRGQRHLLQQAHVGDVHHDGRHPEDVAHLLFLHQLENLHREGRPSVGNDHDAGTLALQQAHLVAPDVEHYWRKRTYYIVFRELVLIKCLRHKVNKALVVEHHALGRTRAAAGIDDAVRVGVDKVGNASQQSLLRWGIGIDLFHINHLGAICRSNRLNNSLELAVGDDRSGLNQRKDVAQTLSRVLHVEVHVGIAAVGDGQISHRSLSTLGHKHSHRAVLALANVDNGLCQLTGLHIKFVEGDTAITVNHCHSLTETTYRFDEVFNKIDFHNFFYFNYSDPVCFLLLAY